MSLDKLGGKHRIALVSNIDDDLLQATPVPGGIDLVCTAERARGYKPDGTLFRYLIANAGVAVPEMARGVQLAAAVARPVTITTNRHADRAARGKRDWNSSAPARGN